MPEGEFYDERYDHYARKGEEPCPDREAAGRFYKGEVPVPRDAHVQCRTCKWARHCFAAEAVGWGLLPVDEIEELDDEGFSASELDGLIGSLG